MKTKAESKDIDIPERCPSCNVKKKSILRHIKAKDSCFKKIDPNIYEKWIEASNRRNKRKYQKDYAKSGAHRKAQSKYVEKCQKEDYDSLSQKMRNKMARYRNRKELVLEESTDRRIWSKKRFKSFKLLAKWCLIGLKLGEIPPQKGLNRFHLVEEDTPLDQKRAHDWLQWVEADLLEAVISFQTIVLVPRSTWINALNAVQNKQDQVEVAAKLKRLIGKLNAYKNKNTREIQVPEEFTSSIMEDDDVALFDWEEKTFSRNDERRLIKMVADILGDEEGLLDEELQDVLQIKNVINNLWTAFNYTS